MNKLKLKELLGKGKELNSRINFYLKNKILVRQGLSLSEIKGHIEKSEHNLLVVDYNLKGGFNDWAIVGCYYAIYHISLALILKKGYFSKNHDATLCVLVKEYYKEGLNEENFAKFKKMQNSHAESFENSSEKQENGNYSNLSEEDLNFLNKIYLTNEDILFYTQSKEEREKASYSTKIIFDKKMVLELRQKTLEFVRKAQEILK